MFRRFDVEGCAFKKVVSPKQKRAIVDYLKDSYRTSCSRACKVLDLQKASFYYKEVVDDGEIKLRSRLKELADKHPDFGLRTLHEIAKREDLAVNHKRTERIYKEEKLSLRLKKKNKRARHLRIAQIPQMLLKRLGSGGFSDQKVTHKCGLKITHLMVNKKDPNGSNCFSNISPKTLF